MVLLGVAPATTPRMRAQKGSALAEATGAAIDTAAVDYLEQIHRFGYIDQFTTTLKRC